MKLDPDELERRPEFRSNRPPPPAPPFQQAQAKAGPSRQAAQNPPPPPQRYDPEATPLRSVNDSVNVTLDEHFDPEFLEGDSFLDEVDQSMATAGAAANGQVCIQNVEIAKWSEPLSNPS